MATRWQLRKAALTTFILAHLGALAVWNLPGGAIRERCGPYVGRYLFATGLWQDWGMFAPDPPKASLRLEGLVEDRHGLVRVYTYPYLADRSLWGAFWGYRHAKYANAVGQPDAKSHREYAARTVIRRLDIPPEAFPVDVQLQYRVRTTPPPGSGSEAALQEPGMPAVLELYRFPTREEAEP